MPGSFRLMGAALAIGSLTAGMSTASAAPASRVSLVPVLSGYTRPVLITHAPGDPRVIFIVEQTGTIKRATRQDGQWRCVLTHLSRLAP